MRGDRAFRQGKLRGRNRTGRYDLEGSKTLKGSGSSRSGRDCRATEQQRISSIDLYGDEKKPERESGVERVETGFCKVIENVGRERLSLPR